MLKFEPILVMRKAEGGHYFYKEKGDVLVSGPYDTAQERDFAKDQYDTFVATAQMVGVCKIKKFDWATGGFL